MDKILAKQVEDMVDKSSTQEISGEKTFTAAAIFDKQTENFNIVIHQGFIYWATDPKQLEQDGNFRYGIVEGAMTSQEYSGEMWNNL